MTNFRFYTVFAFLTACLLTAGAAAGLFVWLFLASPARAQELERVDVALVLAGEKPSACYTIQDHLLVVDNVAKKHGVGTKVFVWTHPKDPKFKAFYVFSKNSPGSVGLSIYYDGCSHPLPNGQAYEAIKLNSSILSNLAAAFIVYDSGEVGLKEADEHVDPTLHDETL